MEETSTSRYKSKLSMGLEQHFVFSSNPVLEKKEHQFLGQFFNKNLLQMLSENIANVEMLSDQNNA